jgi:hypothetical protein
MGPYKSSTGSSYTYNPIPLGWDAAQVSCNEQGGHLASYRSAPEQAEVELFYINGVSGW